MASLKHSQVIRLIANDVGKTEKVTDGYIRAFVDRLYKEMARGNTVQIECFGTFKPIFKGGYELDAFGNQQYIEPRIGIEFKLSDTGLQFLNNKVLTSETRKRMREGNLTRYEKILLGYKDPEEKKEEKIKPPLEDVFNKVINQIKERNSDLLEDDEFCEEEYIDEESEDIE